jgi:hypothetical protein
MKNSRQPFSQDIVALVHPKLARPYHGAHRLLRAKLGSAAPTAAQLIARDLAQRRPDQLVTQFHENDLPRPAGKKPFVRLFQDGKEVRFD